MNQLICTSCQSTYELDESRWKCDCGSLLDLEYIPVFEPKIIKGRKPTMWRYREALPIQHDRNIVSYDEGFTPLVEVMFDDRPVLIKQDHLFPTGSYKDRGASLLMSKVKELGIREVVEDSSGNAGCAIAAYCARAGIGCHIFVPEATAAGKLTQIQLYGAYLHKIPGSREDTATAVLEMAENLYYASHSWNPFFFQGTKTFAFEVCEQLDWQSPDTLIVPVGNGTLLLGAHIGFRELVRAGIIEKIPKLIAIQSARCAPLYHMFKENSELIPPIATEETLAEGIAIAMPIRGQQIVEAVRESQGDVLIVHEAEIITSLQDICRQGFYIEPTSAATLAGVRQYLRTSPGDEVIVSVLTGHGLKTTEKITKIGHVS